jgi:hypothetical protein
VYVLSNSEWEVAVVPQLGAKIISLKNLRTGREWMWHPHGGLKLFRNHAGADFSISPLVGMDECLPTIAPCSWQGRNLPDHGEVWNMSWEVNAQAWQNGILETCVKLRVSPLEFKRTLDLQGNELILNYQLTNLSDAAESYVWAMHPLLRLQAGDQLQLPASTRSLLNGAAWVDAVDSAVPEGRCAKVFARPVQEGFARVCNQETGDSLEFSWEPSENNTLGIWLTRGGWNGHHHFALEPTNGDDDALSMAAERNHCGVIPAGASAEWQVRLRAGSSQLI